MRFNVLCFLLFASTVVSGLVIPSEQLESREPRAGAAKKAQYAANRAAKAPMKAAALNAYRNTKSLPHSKTVYHVPYGAGRPARKLENAHIALSSSLTLDCRNLSGQRCPQGSCANAQERGENRTYARHDTQSAKETSTTGSYHFACFVNI